MDLFDLMNKKKQENLLLKKEENKDNIKEIKEDNIINDNNINNNLNDNNIENKENEKIENIKTNEGLFNIYLINNINKFKIENNIKNLINKNIENNINLVFIIDEKETLNFIQRYGEEYFDQTLIWVYDLDNKDNVKYKKLIIFSNSHKYFNTNLCNRKSFKHIKEYILNFLERDDIIYIENKDYNINEIEKYIRNIAFLKIKTKENNKNKK